jgi:hypothetical protein
MRKFITIIETNLNEPTDAIADFIGELLPDDTGFEDFPGGYRVVYEGFTDLCWDDAQCQGKTIESLEQEIIEDWKGRHPDHEFISSEWRDGAEFFEDTVFLALFKERT